MAPRIIAAFNSRYFFSPINSLHLRYKSKTQKHKAQKQKHKQQNSIAMKKVFYITVAILAMASCTQKSKTLEYTTETLSAKKEVPYADGKIGKVSIDCSYEYPSAGTPEATLKALQKSLIIDALGDSLATDFKKAFDDDIQEIIDIYKEEVDDIYRNMEDGKQPEEYMVTWEYNGTGKFGSTHSSVTSYITELSSYTGGAHGMYYTLGSLYSLKDGNRISQDQYFIDSYEDQLTTLLFKYLRDFEGNELSSGEDDEFTPQPYPNDNIYFTENGVVFTYPPYEIASYAQGQLHAEIPWAEIEPLIRKEYK